MRVVEGQHVVSTRKLVDSDAEQHVLEDLLEGAKPPLPPAEEAAGLHYLLTTPFRYPPLRYGSRFGTRGERGIWYGSDRVETALAETAYYRLVFLAGTEAELEPLMVELTAFRVAVESERGLDLTRPPWDRREAEISSPVRYEAPQRLGRRMREAGIELFRYRSARDPERGTNLGLFTPRAFAAGKPSGLETWYCVAIRQAVELTRRDLLHRGRSLLFPRATFEVDGVLPAPAV